MNSFWLGYLFIVVENIKYSLCQIKGHKLIWFSLGLCVRIEMKLDLGFLGENVQDDKKSTFLLVNLFQSQITWKLIRERHKNIINLPFIWGLPYQRIWTSEYDSAQSWTFALWYTVFIGLQWWLTVPLTSNIYGSCLEGVTPACPIFCSFRPFHIVARES